MNITLSDLVALAGAAVLIYKAITMTPGEVRSTEADTIKKYQTIINDEVDKGLKLSDRIEFLESQKAIYDAEKINWEKEKEEFRATVERLEGIIKRLEHQILSYNKTPVTHIEVPAPKTTLPQRNMDKKSRNNQHGQ